MANKKGGDVALAAQGKKRPRDSANEGKSITCEAVDPLANKNTVAIRAPQDGPRELIKAMAEAVGKSIAAYVEVMYPEAMRAASSTFKTSLKNHVYNDIMHVSTLHTEAEIRAWLAADEAHRKEWLGMYRKMRRKP